MQGRRTGPMPRWGEKEACSGALAHTQSFEHTQGCPKGIQSASLEPPCLAAPAPSKQQPSRKLSGKKRSGQGSDKQAPAQGLGHKRARSD